MKEMSTFCVDNDFTNEVFEDTAFPCDNPDILQELSIKDFGNLEQKDDEIEIQEDSLTGFTCAVCSFSTKHRLIYVDHIASHKDPTHDTCSFCREVYDKKYLNDHMFVCPSNTKEVHKCTYCNYKTFKVASLNRHVKTCPVAKKQQIVCDKCDFTAFLKCIMKEHMILAHSDTKSDLSTTYKCHKCNFKSNSKAGLRKHLKKHVPNKTVVQPYQCQFCSFNCFQKEKYQTHLRTHNKHLCKKCSFSTKQLANFKRHLRNVHKVLC